MELKPKKIAMTFPVWGSFAVGDHLRRCTALVASSLRL